MTDAENHFRDDPISVLEEEARAVARRFGVAACNEVAAAFVDRVLLRLGGGYVYVPRRRTEERQRIRREIADRFNGKNSKELAREFSMTPRHVRRIVAELGPGTPASPCSPLPD